MPRYKSFGSPVTETDKPLTFELYGEEFFASGQIQGAVLMDLVKNSNVDDPAESAGMINDFFAEVLLEESLTRFKAMTTSKDKIVPVETLTEILGWLVEEYSGRPEEPRED